MKQEQYDELQKQRRERIGSQSFFLIVMMLLLDIAVDSLGFRWMEYSTRVFLIVLVCSGVYTIRTITSGAFVAPGVSVSSAWIKVAGTLAVAAAVALVAFKLLGKDANSGTGDNGSMILVLVSGGMLLASVVVAWIKRKKDNEKEE